MSRVEPSVQTRVGLGPMTAAGSDCLGSTAQSAGDAPPVIPEGTYGVGYVLRWSAALLCQQRRLPHLRYHARLRQALA